MRNDATLHRLLRCLTAVVILVAAVAWSALAPLHADGPGLLRMKAVAAAPCHEHATAAADAACDALCAIAAPGHFIGEVTLVAGLAGAKALVPAPVTAIARPVGMRAGPDRVPTVLRSDGAPLYLTTRRLRI